MHVRELMRKRKREARLLWPVGLYPKRGKKFVAKQVEGLNPLLAARR